MGHRHKGKAVHRLCCLGAVLILAIGFASQAASAEALSLVAAVQGAIVRAPDLLLARFAIEEAEIELEEARIGSLAGQPASELQAAELVLQQARDGYIDTLIGIALEVEEAYYGVLRSQELLAIQQRNMEQADRQFAVARARYEAGLISRIEFQQAELSHEQSRYSLEKARRLLDDARRRLARLIGAADGSELLLEDTFPFEPLEISLDEAIGEALQKRREIRQAERNLEQARLRVDQYDSRYVAPVTLEAAQRAVRQAEIQLEQTRLQISETIRSEWWALQDAEYNVGAARRREALALDSLAVAETRFEAGLVSLLDLLQSQGAAAQAMLDAAGAVWDYNLAKARFLRSLGRPELPPLPDEIAAYIAGWADMEGER